MFEVIQLGIGVLIGTGVIEIVRILLRYRELRHKLIAIKRSAEREQRKLEVERRNDKLWNSMHRNWEDLFTEKEVIE